MMKMIRVLAGVTLAALVAACGGGGGSPGTTSGGGGGGTGGGGGGVTPATPKVVLTLVNGAGVATSVVSHTTKTFARAVVTDSAGAAAPNTVVTLSGDSSLVKFVPSSGSALTDSSGVASVEVQPASATAAGAGVLTANATVGGTAATAGTVSYQVPQATSDSPSARVTNFALLLDRSTLANAGTATAKLTVVAVDSSNNVVAGATVVVATDKNSIFVPGGTVTDAQGQYTGQIGIGSDKSDRTITVSATINGMTKSTTVNVVGSKIAIQSTPSTPSPGQAVAVTATATDSAGNAIPGVTVTFGGNVAGLQGQTATTDSSGIASRAFIAPSTAGTYTINASGSGVISADYQLQVFSSTVPLATIPPGVSPSLSASPNVLSVNTPGSTSSRSNLRFLFLDAENKPVQNVRVRFDDKTSGLAAVGASISSGTSTLYTDAAGQVSAQYVAGQNSSPTNGVTVRACYKASDFSSSTECPAFVDVSLTVAGQALAVSIGDDNLLTKGPGTYIKKFAVTVADSAGRAVPNAPVDISVDLTHYGKGIFGANIPVPPINLLHSFPLDTNTVPGESRVWCANEDTNRNGNVDPGENINGSVDTNGQPTLEPRKSDLIVSYDVPTVTATNASGILVIKVEYSQRFATWLAYKVRVTASVAGSQGMAERVFITDAAQEDVPNGSFLEPPYGQSSCRSPN